MNFLFFCDMNINAKNDLVLFKSDNIKFNNVMLQSV